MNEQELSAQRKKAKANLDMVRLHKRSGLASQEDLDQAQGFYDKLKAYQPRTEPIPPAKSPETPATATNAGSLTVEAPAMPAMPVSEFTALLDGLSTEYAQARKNQAILSNQLTQIPPNQNALALVNQIMAALAIRSRIGEKIAYLKAHGQLPEPEPVPLIDQAPEAIKTAFLASLPVERYELHKLLINQLKPKLYRAKKRLAGAKQEVYIRTYQKEVALYEIQVELVNRQIAALS